MDCRLTKRTTGVVLAAAGCGFRVEWRRAGSWRRWWWWWWRSWRRRRSRQWRWALLAAVGTLAVVDIEADTAGTMVAVGIEVDTAVTMAAAGIEADTAVTMAAAGIEVGTVVVAMWWLPRLWLARRLRRLGMGMGRPGAWTIFRDSPVLLLDVLVRRRALLLRGR